MKYPTVLYLLPLVILRAQSHPTPTGDVESFVAGLLSPAPVALPGLLQRISDPVLARSPAREVSSASAFDTSTLPASAVSSSLDLPNGVTRGTVHLSDTTPDQSGVCQGLIEDLDITGPGERQQPSRYTNFVLQGFKGVRISFYLTSILTGRTPEPHHILSGSLD